MIKRYLPVLSWAPSYKRDWLVPDVIAGLTVWALLVPEAIAYASIAGMPPEAGLYTALPAVVAYAIFGTSRQLFVGPSSTVAILSASTIAGLNVEGDEEYFALTAALAIMVGAFAIVAGLARLGWISDFLSRPIMDGFIAGLAFVIIIGQAPKLFGVEGEDGNFWQELAGLIADLGETNGATLVVGAVSLGLLFALERYVPKLPAALLVVILSIVVVSVFDLEEEGVHIVGDIPTGFPDVGLPDVGLDQLGQLVGGALAIVLVAYAETIGIARKYAAKHGYKIDPNQEFIALGTANFGAGLFQGFVVDGSLSRTAAADQAGQRTQLTGFVNAGLLIITIVALASLFENLAEATLGAVVIHAVWHLAFSTAGWRRRWTLNRREFWFSLTCALGVMTIGVLQGLVIAVALSLVALIYRTSYPRTAVLGHRKGADPADWGSYRYSYRFRDVSEHEDDVTIPGLIIFRFDNELFYANANAFKEEIEELVEESDPPARVVLVDAEAISEIDITGADAIAGLLDELESRDVELAFARLKFPAREMLDRAGLLERIGEARLYPTIRAGAEDFIKNDRTGN